MTLGFPVPTPNQTSGNGGTGPDLGGGTLGNDQVAFFSKSGLSIASNILNIGSTTALTLQSYTDSSGALDQGAATFDDFEWLDAPVGSGFCQPVDGLYCIRVILYDPPATAVYAEPWLSGSGAYVHQIAPLIKPLSTGTEMSFSEVFPYQGEAFNGELRLRFRFYTSARALVTSGTGIGIDLHLSQIAAF